MGQPQPADSKKTAYDAWRAAGVATMEVVFAGTNHFFWSAMSPDTAHDLASYYTVAWFDRWLKGQPAATARLLARDGVTGKPVGAVLGAQFRSAAFLDGHDCPDLRTSCP